MIKLTDNYHVDYGTESWPSAVLWVLCSNCPDSLNMCFNLWLWDHSGDGRCINCRNSPPKEVIIKASFILRSHYER